MKLDHNPYGTPVESGQSVRDYEIIDLLGVGCFANTYRARHPIYKDVALKEILVSGITYEINAHKDLGDILGIPKLYEYFTIDGQPSKSYMAIELFDGPTLYEMGWSLNEVELKKGIRSLLSTLDSMHARGWCHNDLNQKNIIIGYDGIFRIVDLGMAMKIDLLSLGDPTSFPWFNTGNTPHYLGLEGDLSGILISIYCALEEKTDEFDPSGSLFPLRRLYIPDIENISDEFLEWIYLGIDGLRNKDLDLHNWLKIGE